MKPKHAYTAVFLKCGLIDGLESFSAFESKVASLETNKERGDAFEVFAEAYLATQKIAMAREVWPFEAIPLDRRRQLSLDTGRDMGVDGIYETTDGELRAYQVKFRSRRPALTWEELSTFMGLTDQVAQRVLFTNCDTLPVLMQDRSGFVAIRGGDLDRLTADDFAAMREWLSSGRVEVHRKQLMPHQEEALDHIAAGLAAQDRATVVMACGTGKSLVSLWAAERQTGHASQTPLDWYPRWRWCASYCTNGCARLHGRNSASSASAPTRPSSRASTRWWCIRPISTSPSPPTALWCVILGLWVANE